MPPQNYKIHPLLITLLLAWLLSGCQSHKAHLLGEWLPANEETALVVSKLWLNHQKGLYWYVANDSIRYRYTLEKGDTLELMNRYGVFHYKLLKLTPKQMVWQPTGNIATILSFKRKGDFKPIPKGKKKPHVPVEKDIQNLIYALTGPDVELRLSNLLDEFDEGDYVTTKTIYHLTGVSSFKRYGEYPEEEIYRDLISKIKAIKRVGNTFELILHKHENIRTSLPINENKEGKKFKQTKLDLFISKDAKVALIPTPKGVKIDIDGVRVGKGWLKVGLPTFRISGNYGHLLGLKFYLAR